MTVKEHGNIYVSTENRYIVMIILFMIIWKWDSPA